MFTCFVHVRHADFKDAIEGWFVSSRQVSDRPPRIEPKWIRRYQRIKALIAYQRLLSTKQTLVR